ncbi:MAG: DeoR family transcriptional regulator, partial [Propionibacterium sp.]|nr:DeoR family transcriptional regulator [Propionibacterium sp.]
MLSEDRQLRIIAHVRERGFVTVSELCELYRVSEATIR